MSAHFTHPSLAISISNLDLNLDLARNLTISNLLFADSRTWEGTFAYHMKPDLLHMGMVVGLDYENPYLNPYMEFQVSLA